MMNWLLHIIRWVHPTALHLGAYSDGELGTVDAEGVSLHLRGCSRCRQIVEARRQTLRLFSSRRRVPEEFDIDAMFAEGRSELMRRLSGRTPVPAPVSGPSASRVEATSAIFGSRVPVATTSGGEFPDGSESRRLDEMCTAILGSKLSESSSR